VRVLCDTASGRSFGSGVLVSPGTLLTARHVVGPSGSNVRALSLQGAAFGVGTVVPDDLAFPDDSDVDLALVLLRPPKLVQESSCALPAEGVTLSVNVGDKVVVAGCSRIDGPVESEEVRIQSLHGKAGVLVCNKALPKGFSGGPVFADGLLVGVVYARNHEQGHSYLYVGHAFESLVRERASGPVAWTAGRFSPLRRFPLGPAMSPDETAARLSHLIERCALLYPGHKARSILARANRMRLECGPDTGSKGLIQVSFLRDPGVELYGFWFDAFMMATTKSPRMLAALLLALEDDPFDTTERAEKADVLSRLELLKHSQ
jgi:Trypsin-like peptidase domain